MTLDEAAEKLSYYISTHILTKRMTYSTFKVSLRSYYFNSHPHEEDDLSWYSINWTLSISTHILTKRMTEEGLDVIVEEYISTHILTKRMTPFNSVPLYWKKISTHILTKRMTFTCPCTHNITFYFNSHPHEEDDCYRCISLPT